MIIIFKYLRSSSTSVLAHMILSPLRVIYRANESHRHIAAYYDISAQCSYFRSPACRPREAERKASKYTAIRRRCSASLASRGHASAHAASALAFCGRASMPHYHYFNDIRYCRRHHYDARTCPFAQLSGHWRADFGISRLRLFTTPPV